MTKNAKKAKKSSILNFDCPLACIPDAEYSALMESTVKPYISARREIGFFEPRSGQKMRFAKYTADGAHDTAVISHGFTETLEKYDETVYYLLKRGYNVFICEHRGHGLSYREHEDYSIAHVQRFDDYVNDFLFFLGAVVKPESLGRLCLIAHSMGGAIGALAMERQPNTFDKAAMLSPMFGVNLPAPKPVTYALACAMCAAGRGGDYVVGQKPFSGVKDFENSACACAERYDYFFKRYVENPYMQGCAASYGWVRESIRGTDALMKPAALERIKTPVLVFSGTADEVVSKPAHCRFTDGVECARLITVPKGKHELFTDTAERNGALWREIFAFF